LIDLHSMPSIPAGQPGHGARIIVGDRFGGTAGDWLIDLIMASAERLGEPVARNQPYAGGHIIRTHGRRAEAIHAVQIEIDRSLYLTQERLPDSGAYHAAGALVFGSCRRSGASAAHAELFPQAAE
jgi:N-formylglutamate amidohydrolase